MVGGLLTWFKYLISSFMCSLKSELLIKGRDVPERLTDAFKRLSVSLLNRWGSANSGSIPSSYKTTVEEFAADLDFSRYALYKFCWHCERDVRVQKGDSGDNSTTATASGDTTPLTSPEFDLKTPESITESVFWNSAEEGVRTARKCRCNLLEMDPAGLSRERFAIKKSYSIENGYPASRRSLVEDAKFESTIKKQQKQSWIQETAKQLSCDSELSEEVIFVSSATEQVQTVSLVLGLIEGISALPRIIKTVENFNGTIAHLESREAGQDSVGQEVLLRVVIEKDSFLNLFKSLRQGASTSYVSLIPDQSATVREFWFPKHISELDLCNHLMTKFEPDLDRDHPGFSDLSYRARRKEIADIAFTYHYGEHIPRICYKPEEIETWGAVYKELDRLVPTHACQQYRNVWNILKTEGIYNAEEIPQLQDVSDFIKCRTGFTLRPAAGLLTARDFLASLAFRVFQCTQYVRHYSSPHHSPEPDVVHELLGHVPLLADPEFSQFSQELGLASLGATDEEIEKFATMYWFTVEFGLCYEGSEIRAWGAGLLSSYGELQHALSDKPQHVPFEPTVTAIQEYQDQDYQNIYFVANSVHDAQNKFRNWTAKTLQRPFDVRYDYTSNTVIILNSGKEIKKFVASIALDLDRLRVALEKIHF